MTMFRHLAVVIVVVLTCSQFALAKVDTLFVVPGSHLDIGFTDLPSKSPATRVAILDEAIGIAKRDPDFRWTEEGGWVIEQWLKAHRKDKPAIDVLKHFLHTGQISISAMYLTPHTAVIPELQRALMIHLDGVAKQLDYRPKVAILNDVPSHPQALIDALASRGIKYLLIGANMTFKNNPLPAKMARSPFYWESEHGKRVLVFVDQNNYCGAFQLFGLGPECSRVFNRERFPASMSSMNVMRSGLNDLLANSPSAFDAQVIQHAYDNWNTECARDLLVGARAWNSAGNKPNIKLAAPEEYFLHIERKYGKHLPVYREEWGGQWDEIRAVSPVWTWRIREAAKIIMKHPSHDAAAAILLAMDHNVHLGEIWPKFFTEFGVRQYAKECADMFGDAVKRAGSKVSMTSAPSTPSIPKNTAMTGQWATLLAGNRPLRVRSGHWPGTPFVDGNAPEWNTPMQYGIEGSRIAANVHIDRRHIPGADRGDVSVVVEIPLRAPMRSIHIAPVESPAGMRNAWLRPPQFVIAADGLRVTGLAKPITVRAPLIFSWILIPDRSDPNITWLQGMVVRQTLFCQLKGGGTKVLPFEAWFPGEPAVVDAGVEIEW